jgi:hypothetical protein
MAQTWRVERTRLKEKTRGLILLQRRIRPRVEDFEGRIPTSNHALIRNQSALRMSSLGKLGLLG